MMALMETIKIRARVRIAHADDHGAKVFRKSIHNFVVTADEEEYRFGINCYMVHIPEAHYRPIDPYLLEKTTSTIIDTDMVRERTNPRVSGFGSRSSSDADGNFLVSYESNGIRVEGPVIRVGPWGRVFSNQI